MELNALPGAILPWYRENRRALPWRETNDPYRIWVSEIMLQQTRVEAVKGYYARFLAALPDIESLARCDDERLHKLWEGLGYYSRVRNLKKAAGVILERHGGVFPADPDAVRALPGIGDYTAGAVCSIAFSLPTPAVDGNVLRVLSRLRCDAEPIDLPAVKKRVSRELAEIYPTDCPGEFTQALMELGATVCVPNGEPKCAVCPCRSFCEGQTRWQELPVKLPKRRKSRKTARSSSCAAVTGTPSRSVPARDFWPGCGSSPTKAAIFLRRKPSNGQKIGDCTRKMWKSPSTGATSSPTSAGTCGAGFWRWARWLVASPG